MMRSIQLVRSLSFLLFPKSEQPAYEIIENSVSGPKRVERHSSLRQVSREHHNGLLLCWKIRTGLSKKVDLERIEKYTNWYFINHLIPHFEYEAKDLFPILGNNHKLVEKAMSAHHKLRNLFTCSDDLIEKLYRIQNELELHIRFEEHELLNELQRVSTKEQLESIALCNPECKFIENETDPFWK